MDERQVDGLAVAAAMQAVSLGAAAAAQRAARCGMKADTALCARLAVSLLLWPSCGMVTGKGRQDKTEERVSQWEGKAARGSAASGGAANPSAVPT